MLLAILLDEIKTTKKECTAIFICCLILLCKTKIDPANWVPDIMDRYPEMTVKELLYLIDCRIEGEKFVISSYRWSVPMLQETYDNRDNLERLHTSFGMREGKCNGTINTIF